MIQIREVLATNLKKYRQALGWSQAKLAERMNTSTHYIGMIEIGKKFPKPEMIERLADTLGIKSPQLFFNEESPTEAMAHFRKAMLEDFQGMVVDYVQGKIKDLEE